MVCAARGYPFVATMVETFSIERRKIMRAFGAKVILTPAAERGTGMVRRAEELAQQARLVPGEPVRESRQSRLPPADHGPGNPAAISPAGGSTSGSRAGVPGGTLTGAGEVIKAARPDVRIVATEPEGASLLGGKEWKPHKIQGWTPDFVPGVLNPKVVDELVTVSDDEAKATALRLAREEGIFVGLSSGGTLAAGLKVAAKATKGSSILVMLPDTGERYLSTFLFQEIPEGSDDEWLASLGHGGKAA